MASEHIASTGVRVGSLGPRLSTWRYWGPVGLYAGFIFFGSSISNPPEVLSPIIKEFSDKALHLFEYSILGALSYRACRHASGSWVARHAVAVAVAGCALYGLSDEIHQLFVPFREGGDPLDVMADVAGATLGAWIWHWLERRQASFSSPSPGA
jgi:VanZ family protein